MYKEQLQQIKEAAFIDELQKTEDGIAVGVSLGIFKSAEQAIPPVRVTPKPINTTRARAQARFAASPLGQIKRPTVQGQ